MNFYSKKLVLTIFCAVLAGFSTILQAKEQKNPYAPFNSYKEKFLKELILSRYDGLQASFKDWSVYKVLQGDRYFCYLLSTPIHKDGDRILRGESYFIVNDIENDANEITVASGFSYKDTSNVEISFGAQKYYLLPYKATAWAYSKNDDIDIIKDMQKNDEFIVSSMTTNNKIINDTYSLIGFTQAYFKLKDICKNDRNIKMSTATK